MKRVLTALVLIPLVLLAVFRAPDWLFTLLVGVVAVLATIEYLQIAAKYGYKVYPWVTCGAVAIVFGLVAMPETGASNITPWGVLLVAGLTMAFTPSLMLAQGMRSSNLRDALPGAALSFFAVPYIGLCLLCLAILRQMAVGWFMVLFTFFAVWVGDTAAYYVGRSIGKTKFAARISPKKTWEGAIASVVGAMVVGVVFAWFAHPLQTFVAPPFGELVRAPIWVPAVIALVINVAAQLGDLFESMIKRGADVKDSGTMLPGHGGILDRIDALLFAAPVALVMFLIFGEKFYRYM
jgi:phosphatidate cytidylyltransferase